MLQKFVAMLGFVAMKMVHARLNYNSNPTSQTSKKVRFFIIILLRQGRRVRKKERWLASPLTGTGTAFELTCYHTSG